MSRSYSPSAKCSTDFPHFSIQTGLPDAGAAAGLGTNGIRRLPYGRVNAIPSPLRCVSDTYSRAALAGPCFRSGRLRGRDSHRPCSNPDVGRSRFDADAWLRVRRGDGGGRGDAGASAWRALCDDPDAIAVLDASQINIERLRADVTARAYQGGVQSQSPSSGGLAVSHDVRRILEAAAAAARGSRRRDINGAIVLAAIVGDARSMAAEILQAHGLNFDNAIRALQAALAPARDVPAQVPVADDVLARARERVQSRSAPSLRDMMKDMPRVAPPQPVAVPETAEKVEKAPPAPAATAPPAAGASCIPCRQARGRQQKLRPKKRASRRLLVFRRRQQAIGGTGSGFRSGSSPVPAPAPAAFHAQREPGSMPAAAEPALPFPSHPASPGPGGGFHPPPQQRPAWQPGPPSSGRDIPDFIRERKGDGHSAADSPRRVRFQACPPALILARVPVLRFRRRLQVPAVLAIGLYRRALRRRSSGRSEVQTNGAASR